MAKRMINQTHIEGWVYEHTLQKRISGENSKNPGTPFIMGNLSIAVDDEHMNVIQVHFSYVAPTTASKKTNPTYGVLESIIDGKIGSIMEHGEDLAGKVRVDSAIGLNEWYDYTKPDTPLISNKCNEGGFVHVVTGQLCPEKQRATFETDILITGVKRIEADPERNTEEKMIVKGAIFNFRDQLLPVEFSINSLGLPNKAHLEGAMNYFESLEASQRNPVFTKVRGLQISQTVVRTIKEESAFAEDAIKETRTSYKDFVITWAPPTTYDWDSEETLLASELTERIAQREIDLATLKKRNEEYQAQKGTPVPTVSNEADYDF